MLVALLLVTPALRPAIGPNAGPVLRGGLLLVASERLSDPNFARTVLLLLEANDDGAVALILNRPLPGTLQQVIPELPERASEVPLYAGGPVQRAQIVVLMRSDGEAPGVVPVLEGVRVTRALDALHEVLRGVPPSRLVRAYLGYAGWAAGQLQGEMERGDWYVLETDAAEVFDTRAEAFWPLMQKRAAGLWVQTPPRLQPPSRSTSTDSRSPPASISTRTRIGWQHTEQSSTYSWVPG